MSRKEFADIRDIANEIRARVEQRYQGGPVEPAEVADVNAAPLIDHFVPPRAFRATELAGLVRSGQALVGNLPPSPPTLRGSLGRILVSFVSRALFWYTPQIQSFQRMSAEAAREQSDTLEAVAGMAGQLHSGLDAASARIQSLERQNAELRQNMTRLTEIATGQDKLRERIAELERNQNESRETQESVAQDVLGALALAKDATQELRDAELKLREAAQKQREVEQEQVTQRITERIVETERATQGLASRIDALGQKLTGDSEQRREAERLLFRLRSELAVHARRLDSLFLEVRRDHSALAPATEETEMPALDESLYARFEDAFRGSREDIKERLRSYLERLDPVLAGTQVAPILDVGCGRCEWLELLAEHGMKARGVDTNQVFVEEGRMRGLEVVYADGLSYLKSLPEASVGAVTAFHVIEHLDFAGKLELLDQSLRVLKPGGLLILETPNPENILVSTRTFYYDPTHRQPVPAELLKFLVEARGYCLPEVLPLHPYPEAIHLDEGLGPLATFLNYYFYGCQDYAILARKA